MLTARRKQCQGEKGIGISDPLDWESENGREGEMAREGGAEKSLRRESGATEQGSYSCPTSLCFASTCELCVCVWLSFLLTSSEPKLFAPPPPCPILTPPPPNRLTASLPPSSSFYVSLGSAVGPLFQRHCGGLSSVAVHSLGCPVNGANRVAHNPSYIFHRGF